MAASFYHYIWLHLGLVFCQYLRAMRGASILTSSAAGPVCLKGDGKPGCVLAARKGDGGGWPNDQCVCHLICVLCRAGIGG